MSADGSVTYDDWWLRDPLDATRDRIVVVRPGWRPSKRLVAGVWEPLGRDFAVVSEGDTYGITGMLPLRVLDEDAYDAVWEMVLSHRTLLLQSPIGHSWYLRVVGNVVPEPIRSVPMPGEPYVVRHAHTIDLPVVEVEPVWPTR